MIGRPWKDFCFFRVKKKTQGNWCLRPQLLTPPLGRPCTLIFDRGIGLSKAYKQINVHPAARTHAVVAVRKADGAWTYFVSRALPFGARTSAFAFNKLNKAIWHVLTCRLKVLCTVFYDDYPVIEHLLLCLPWYWKLSWTFSVGIMLVLRTTATFLWHDVATAAGHQAYVHLGASQQVTHHYSHWWCPRGW